MSAVDMSPNLGLSQESPTTFQKGLCLMKALVSSLSHIGHVLQVRIPGQAGVALEIDAAAIGEECALIVECKSTLDHNAALQLERALQMIP